MPKKLVAIFSMLALLFTTVGFTPNNIQASTLEPDDLISPAQVTGCDHTLSGYQYHSTINGNTKVDKLVGAGASIIISAYVPWNRVKISVQLANTFHMVLKDNVYYTHTYSRMYANVSKTFRPVAAEKLVTRYYSNSARTKLIDTKTTYNYTSWYCK